VESARLDETAAAVTRKLAEKHSWGCIGFVLGFKNRDSLVAADPHDCGSIEEMPTTRDLGDDEERQQAGTGAAALAPRAAKRPRRR